MQLHKKQKQEEKNIKSLPFNIAYSYKFVNKQPNIIKPQRFLVNDSKKCTVIALFFFKICC